MRRLYCWLSATALVGLTALSAAVGGEGPRAPEARDSGSSNAPPALDAAKPDVASLSSAARAGCWPGRLEAGTRSTGFMLSERRKSSSTFYGSIDRLDAVQNFWPIKAFVDWVFTPRCGIELTWDQVQFDTITRSDGHNDGTVDLRGPILSAFARYPNSTVVTPRMGVGAAFMQADFHEDYRWRYALKDAEQTSYYGFEQSFRLDDAWGWVVDGGLSIRVHADWFADLYARYTRVDVHGTHYNVVWGETVSATGFSLPADNLALGAGVRHVF